MRQKGIRSRHYSGSPWGRKRGYSEFAGACVNKKRRQATFLTPSMDALASRASIPIPVPQRSSPASLSSRPAVADCREKRGHSEFLGAWRAGAFLTLSSSKPQATRTSFRSDGYASEFAEAARTNYRASLVRLDENNSWLVWQ